MTGSVEHDWLEIEHLVRTTDLSFYAIGQRTGAALSTVRRRAAKGQWRPGLKVPPPSAKRVVNAAANARRALIKRFYKAIDTKLKQMELRMKTDMEKGEGAASAADHERDTRAIGGLINQLGKISEYETDLDRPTGQGEEFTALAAEAERYRRELAERLARLLPPLE